LKDNAVVCQIDTKDNPSAAVFSPDGRRLIVTNSNDKVPRLLDAQSGKKLLDLPGQGGYRFAAAFAPDGRTVALTTAERSAIVVECETGRVLQTCAASVAPMQAMLLTPDSKRLLLASRGGVVDWNVATGPRSVKLQEPLEGVVAFDFSGDGKLVCARNDKLAAVWDLEGRKLLTISHHNQRVHLATFSPDGKQLLTTGTRSGKPPPPAPGRPSPSEGKAGEEALLWDIATGRRVQSFALGDSFGTRDAQFSPDGSRLTLHIQLPVNPGEHGKAIVHEYDVKTGEKLRKLDHMPGLDLTRFQARQN